MHQRMGRNLRKRRAAAIVAIVLAIAMLAACQPANKTTAGSTAALTTTAAATDKPTTVTSQTSGSAGTTTTTIKPSDQTGAPTTTAAKPQARFPLEKPFKFTIMFKGNMDFAKDLPKISFYQKLVEDTNVSFDWVNLGDEPMAKLNAMFISKSEGDVIFGMVLNDAAISDMASSGLLMPIEQCVTDPKVMPNYNERGISKMPEVLGMMTAPDGHIYSLARINMPMSSYLESPMKINQKWLDKIDAKAPETLAELEDILRKFRDQDMNDNGNPNDEIPLFAANNAGTYSSVQTLLSMWGIATKNSALDSYTTIEKGKVNLAPTGDAYKAAIKTIGNWYKEGFLWKEIYTANVETIVAKVTNDIPLYGVVLSNWDSVEKEYFKDLTSVSLPKPEGYSPRAYINPGFMGYKNTFTLTRSCKDPETVLAWVDQFYSLENSVAVREGLPGEGRYTIENGKFVYVDLDNVALTKLEESKPTLNAYWGNLLNLFNQDDVESGAMRLSDQQKVMNNTYDLYKAKGQINPEPWPRPYFDGKDSARAAELRTDIFNIISKYEAQWVTAQSDIDSDWDTYLGELKRAGLEEFTAILQRSYDTFQKGMEKYKK